MVTQAKVQAPGSIGSMLPEICPRPWHVLSLQEVSTASEQVAADVLRPDSLHAFLKSGLWTATPHAAVDDYEKQG